LLEVHPGEGTDLVAWAIRFECFRVRITAVHVLLGAWSRLHLSERLLDALKEVRDLEETKFLRKDIDRRVGMHCKRARAETDNYG
jgi:hypothetical protein